MTYDEIFDYALEKHGLADASKQRKEAFLTEHFGLTKKMLTARYGKEATPAGVSDIAERLSDARINTFIEASIVPIIEYFPLEAAESKGNAVRIFSTADDEGVEIQFYTGLKHELERSNGVYIFYDSRGRAIYAGKAYDQSLWIEMNNAYNRDRVKVQHIKLTSYPTTRGSFSLERTKSAQIVRRPVKIHEIATYFTAYKVPKPLISKIESLLVRAFANDLLNIRMERV